MDTVGHNKIAINIVWTLIAGFLVMFMQAGFALVETGFTPRQERGAHDGDELHGLRASACSASGSAASRCRWAASARVGDARRRRAPLDHEFTITLVRQAVRACSACKGFFLTRRRLRRRRVRAVPVPDGVHGHRRDDPDRRDGRALEVLGVRRLRLLHRRRSSTRSSRNWVWGGGWLSQLGTNFGLGHGHVDFAGSLGRAHGRRRRRRWPARSCIGPRIGKYNKDGKANADPRPQHPDGRCSARSSWPSAGSASTPGSTLAGDGPAHRASSPSNTMLAVGGRRVRGDALHVAALRQARPDA